MEVKINKLSDFLENFFLGLLYYHHLIIFNSIELYNKKSPFWGGKELEWCPQEESNLHLRIRNPPFYPLNYGGNTIMPNNFLIKAVLLSTLS